MASSYSMPFYIMQCPTIYIYIFNLVETALVWMRFITAVPTINLCQRVINCAYMNNKLWPLHVTSWTTNSSSQDGWEGTYPALYFFRALRLVFVSSSSNTVLFFCFFGFDGLAEKTKSRGLCHDLKFALQGDRRFPFSLFCGHNRK